MQRTTALGQPKVMTVVAMAMAVTASTTSMMTSRGTAAAFSSPPYHPVRRTSPPSPLLSTRSFRATLRQSSTLRAASASADGDTRPDLLEEDDEDARLERLRRENEALRERVEELEQASSLQRGEMHLLQQQQQNEMSVATATQQPKYEQRLILESFEGEGAPTTDARGGVVHGWMEGFKTYNEPWDDVISDDEEPCEIDYDEKTGTWFSVNDCPMEPDVTFKDALKSRAYWLVGLLALQSCSGFILSQNEALLQEHPVIIYFLTMLVGAGGNAGNQASVRVIRGLALGTLTEQTQNQFIKRELRMAFALSAILSLAGFIRAAIFRTPFPETLAVTIALSIIVFSSVCLGAVLPLLLKRLGVDPAHSSTSIQVIMDILGVVLTVAVSTSVLDSPMGKMMVSGLTSWGL